MKLIIVTGWVLSWIGKWITWASIWAILKAWWFNIFMQKFDWYLNVDPWTMSPFQHWEVFVTEDWAETDLDLWHYERFIDTNLNKLSSFTSWKLYDEILKKERAWDYLWKTVQIIPHLTDLVKSKIIDWFTQSKADISIVEIGWTVWDMENEYYLESVRQLQTEYWKENVIFIHLTLLPYIIASKELKTKPTQHSVRQLMSYWIIPDFIVLRADSDIPKEVCDKVASFCNIDKNYVIPAPTVKSIYEVPINFQEFNIWNLILNKFKLENRDFDLKNWKSLLNNINNSKEEINIAMVWKYNDLEDAYYSLNEWLKTAWYYYNKKVKLNFIDATDLENNWVEILKSLDWICIPGWFWDRWIEWMVLACNYSRINNIPYLWICLWSQIMAIEFARNVMWISKANSEEFFPDWSHNVVHIMEDQKEISDKWWTMRLWSYECVLRKWTLAYNIYNSEIITERHRHRFEFNNSYREEMEQKWFIISWTSLDWKLVEIVEIKNHRFMIWTQAHPEFKSRPINPHPLFLKFIQSIVGI